MPSTRSPARYRCWSRVLRPSSRPMVRTPFSSPRSLSRSLISYTRLYVVLSSALTVEGLFRLSGEFRVIDELMKKFDKGTHPAARTRSRLSSTRSPQDRYHCRFQHNNNKNNKLIDAILAWLAVATAGGTTTIQASSSSSKPIPIHTWSLDSSNAGSAISRLRC